MVRSVRCQIDILAPPECVWTVLTDFSAYSEWNPSVLRAEGRACAGEQLTIRARLPGGFALTMPTRVVACEPGRILCWQGHLWSPAVFSGRHSFTLEPLAGGAVRLVQEEIFTGALAPLFAFNFGTALLRSYDATNRALKSRAERFGALLPAGGGE